MTRDARVVLPNEAGCVHRSHEAESRGGDMTRDARVMLPNEAACVRSTRIWYMTRDARVMLPVLYEL